jgi:ComF family protein
LAAPHVRCVFSRDSGAIALDLPPSPTTRWRAVARVLRSPLDAVSCALLPASCALCGSPLPQLFTVPICDSCWAEFPALDPAINGSGCTRCGDSLDSLATVAGRGSGQALCRACRLAPPQFVRAVAYGLYEGRMKDAIHALKYDRLHPAARPLGRMLAAAIAQLASEAPAELLVVPIPLHRTKQHQRGFNQARVLAREAIAALRTTHPGWRLTLAPSTLMRLRATDSQAGLTSRQRRLNVNGAFAVSDRAAVEKQHVLLVDDILTTGATARAAARALSRAGAASIWVATLARARKVAYPFPNENIDQQEREETLKQNNEQETADAISGQVSTEGQKPF